MTLLAPEPPPDGGDPPVPVGDAGHLTGDEVDPASAAPGREGELARALAALTGPAGDHGTVLVTGSAGVGKTWLAHRVAQHLRTGGTRTEWLVGTATGRRIPFGALAPLGVALDDGADDATVLTAATREVLARLAADPVALVVDDAQLLDERSALFVAQLVRSRRLPVVLTVRSGEAVPAELAGVAAAEEVTTLRLGPLDAAAAGRLVRAEVPGPVADDTVAMLVDRADGMPLLVLELTRGAVDGGQLARDEAGVLALRGEPAPTSRLAEVIEARLSGLGPDARDALEVVAAGQPVPRHAAVRDLGLAPLATLERAGFVDTDTDGDGEVLRVAHPVYAETLRSVCGPLAWAAATDRAATLLSAAEADDGDRTLALRAAVLRLDAELPIASAAAVRAAELAATRLDHALAEELARDAVRTARDPEERAEAALALGAALAAQLRVEEAADHLEVAARDARRPDQLARARSRLAVSLATRRGRATEGAAVLETARDELARRFPVAAGEDAAAAVHDRWDAYLLADLSYCRSLAGEVVVPPAVGADGGPIDPVAAANVHLYGSLTCVVAGQLDAAHAHVDAGLPLAPALTDNPVAADLFALSRYLAHQFEGRPERARDVIDAGRDRATRDRPALVGTWLTASAMQHAWSGVARTAATEGRAACDALEAADYVGMRPIARATLALAGVRLGDTETVVAALAGVPDGDGADPKAAALAGQAAGWLLRGPAAADALVEVARRADARGHLAFGMVAAHDAVLAVRGPHDGATAFLAVAATRIDGPLAPLLAAHAAAVGSDDPTELGPVIESLATAGLPWSAAVAADVAADVAAAAGRTARAAAWRERSRRLWRRHPGLAPLPGAAGGAAMDTAALTARERQVAELAAARLRSREIADRLGISVRTVDNQLGAVYRKLGVRRRDELAAALGLSR